MGFFKAWAPAIKAYARDALNKTNFGMWGEFFVPSGRFATMTGRGKDNTMYGDRTRFLPGGATLNGGIDYDPYHYFRYLLMRNELAFPLPAQYYDDAVFDGLSELWRLRGEQLDTYNPLTGRDENTMWHFCNNHDQWRFSTLDEAHGLDLFRVCLGWLSFWPGVPLHYAGDEQVRALWESSPHGTPSPPRPTAHPRPLRPTARAVVQDVRHRARRVGSRGALPQPGLPRDGHTRRR